MNILLKHFNQLGIESDLNFSSQEVLKDCILGLDGVHRRILVVTVESGRLNSFIIDLNRVVNCSIKKIYGTIKAGDLKSHQLEQYLEKIVLHFEMDNKPPVEIRFYDHLVNDVFETPELEQKARNWGIILSKILWPVKKIA